MKNAPIMKHNSKINSKLGAYGENMYMYLNAEMKIQKITQNDIAMLLGISRNTICNKMRGISEFTSSEMFAIQKAFFPDKNLEYLFAKVE